MEIIERIDDAHHTDIYIVFYLRLDKAEYTIDRGHFH